MPGIKIFVSHPHGESELAAFLKGRLVEDFIGLVSVFVSSDYKSIDAGKQWFQELLECVRSADLHLFLCSQHSITSPWINIELGAALGGHKQLIPICHTDLKFEDFKVRPLSDYQGFDASNPNGVRSLYDRIANALGSSVPKADFAQIAERIQQIEKGYLAIKATKAESAGCPPPDNANRRLPNPRVLCITSVQFQEVVREDIRLIYEAFPHGTHHELVTEAADLKHLLVREQFDIIHVANQTCPVTGDLVFSAVTPGRRFEQQLPETLPATTFVKLVRECNATLVVLANNETLPLLAKLLPVTSVVFAEEPVDIKMLISWLRTFYGFVAENYSLAEACRKTFVQHQIPMHLYPRLFRSSEDEDPQGSETARPEVARAGSPS
jgi:hypothetical protein